MERPVRESEIREIEFQIQILKKSQWKHPGDEEYFHHVQKEIDELESRLDVLTRLEQENECV